VPIRRRVRPLAFAVVALVMLSSAATPARAETAVVDLSGQVSVTGVATGTAMADVTGDGVPDLIASTEWMDGGAKLYVWKAAANGTLPTTPTQTLPLTAAVSSDRVVAGDLDGDGKTDAVVQRDGGFDLFVQQGGGLSAAGSVANTNPYPAELSVVDVNVDGRGDLVFFGYDDQAATWRFVWRKQGAAGAFQAPVVIGSDDQMAGGAMADLNEDGLPDAVFSTIDHRTTLIQQPDHTFVAGPPTAVAIGNLSLGDVTGDGHADLVAIWANDYEGDSGYEVVAGRGDGTFKAPARYTTGLTFVGTPYIVDLNADGRNDVAMPAGQIAIALQAPDGTMDTTCLSGLNARYQIGFADVTADGLLDGLVPIGGAVRIYSQLHSGTQVSGGIYVVAPSDVMAGESVHVQVHLQQPNVMCKENKTIHVTRTIDGVAADLPDLVTTGDFAAFDDVPPRAGTVTYSVSWGGDDWYPPLSGSGETTVYANDASVTLTASTQEVTFGESATMEATLTGPPPGSTVKLFAKISGKPQRLIRTGTTDADGLVTFSVTPGQRTTYRVQYPGSDLFEMDMSAPVDIEVAVIVTARLRRWYDRTGDLFLYRSRDDVLLVFEVTPNHRGKDAGVELDRKKGHRWKYMGYVYVTLNKHSVGGVLIRGGSLTAGRTYRLLVDFSDNDHATGNDMVTFRVT
jgi:hypothetical protein